MLTQIIGSLFIIAMLGVLFSVISICLARDKPITRFDASDLFPTKHDSKAMRIAAHSYWISFLFAVVLGAAMLATGEAEHNKAEKSTMATGER